MRAEAGMWEILNYKFAMEFDSGGDPDCPFTLWIYKDREPMYFEDSEIQIRKDFKKNYSKTHVNNFCFKFANNEEYRNLIIKGGNK